MEAQLANRQVRSSNGSSEADGLADMVLVNLEVHFVTLQALTELWLVLGVAVLAIGLLLIGLPWLVRQYVFTDEE